MNSSATNMPPLECISARVSRSSRSLLRSSGQPTRSSLTLTVKEELAPQLAAYYTQSATHQLTALKPKQLQLNCQSKETKDGHQLFPTSTPLSSFPNGSIVAPSHGGIMTAPPHSAKLMRSKTVVEFPVYVSVNIVIINERIFSVITSVRSIKIVKPGAQIT